MLYRIAYVPFEYANKCYIYSHIKQLMFEVDPQKYKHLEKYWVAYNGEGLTLGDAAKHCDVDVVDILFKPDSVIVNDDKLLNDGSIHYADSFAVTFEVTHDCNMLCKHCWYGGRYKNVRGRSDKSLSLKQMIDATNTLQSRIGSKPVHFLFFGGEPTLRLNDISKFIKHANSEFENATYGMTTNLLEYNECLADLCNDDDMRVTISLDGYKDAHDYGRVDSRGNPTFETVKRNLELLMSQVDDLSKLSLSVVMTPAFDIEMAYSDIQSSSFSILSDNITANYLSHSDTDMIFDLYSDAQNDKFSSQNETMFDKLADHIRRECQPGVPKLISRSWIKLFRDLQMDLDYEVHRPYYSGFCYPGQSSVYVKADGRFRVCIMADYDSHGFDIGSVDSGVDEQACKEVYNKSLRFARHNCHCCKALPVCKKCVGLVSCSPKWSDEASATISYCKSVKSTAQNVLSAYFDLRVNSPEFFIAR